MVIHSTPFLCKTLLELLESSHNGNRDPIIVPETVNVKLNYISKYRFGNIDEITRRNLYNYHSLFVRADKNEQNQRIAHKKRLDSD